MTNTGRQPCTGCAAAAQRLRVAEGVNYQSLGEGDDGVILSLQSGYLYRCNHSAIVMLELLRDAPTVDHLIGQFANRFAIDAQRARADLLPLIGHLVQQRLVEKVA